MCGLTNSIWRRDDQVYELTCNPLIYACDRWLDVDQLMDVWQLPLWQVLASMPVWLECSNPLLLVFFVSCLIFCHQSFLYMYIVTIFGKMRNSYRHLGLWSSCLGQGPSMLRDCLWSQNLPWLLSFGVLMFTKRSIAFW